MISRFDYVKYDSQAAQQQNELRAECRQLETLIQSAINGGQTEISALYSASYTTLNLWKERFTETEETKLATDLLENLMIRDGDIDAEDDYFFWLEEAYYWAGKNIRNAQIARNEAAQ